MTYSYSGPQYEYVGSYSNGIMNFALGFFLVFMIVLLAVLIVMVVANYKIFRKAGKEGWESLIPIYGAIVKLQFLNIPVWFILIYLIPGANLVSHIIVNLNLAKKFDKDIFFALGLIILPVIFYPILAFSNAEYNSYAVGVFESQNISGGSYCTNCGSLITGNFCTNCGNKRV